MPENTPELNPPQNQPGRLIIKYLQKNADGATVSEILRYLRGSAMYKKEPTEDLSETVQSVLENAAALGFLECKGSHYLNWAARETCCGRRRLRRRSCGRRRMRRRRSLCRRRRRRY